MIIRTSLVGAKIAVTGIGEVGREPGQSIAERLRACQPDDTILA
ncbi:MAG: hypothetical protein ABSB52_14200 [Acidimicrobiales bacterium]